MEKTKSLDKWINKFVYDLDQLKTQSESKGSDDWMDAELKDIFLFQLTCFLSSLFGIIYSFKYQDMILSIILILIAIISLLFITFILIGIGSDDWMEDDEEWLHTLLFLSLRNLSNTSWGYYE